MSAEKEGTAEEKHKIRKLLKDDDFKTLSTYRPVWISMFASAVRDAEYHCNLTRNALAKKKFTELSKFSPPEIILPSFSLVYTFISFRQYKNV